jgi:ribosomal protein S18 acetylase RimI-like enzyme
MIEIKEATTGDIDIIREIAFKTWPVTYGDILTKENLDYMLGLFYSAEMLRTNFESGHHFLLAVEDSLSLGFASFYHAQTFTKIPKIYILPQAQGKGIGRMLIDRIACEAQANGSASLMLNVNRNNSARFFYERLGFEIESEEDVRLPSGIFQEDFVMVKKPE